jgi:hypothetical protein
MLYDLRKAKARRKKAQRRELDRPVRVALLPTENFAARKEAAVLAWYARLFDFYNVDPAAPSRWEQLAWRLTLELFPNFRIDTSQPKVGNPGTREKVLKLFQLFDGYQVPRGAGSKYKKFWREHRAACAACNIKTAESLRLAMRRARPLAAIDRSNTELLIRAAAMKAYGIGG